MGNVVICLEFILFFKNKRKEGKKVLPRTLKLTKEFREQYLSRLSRKYFSFYLKKKPLLFIVINERKKMKVYLAFLITSMFPIWFTIPDWRVVTRS